MNNKVLLSSVIVATTLLSPYASAGTPNFFGYARMGAAASNGDDINPEASKNTSGQNIIKTAGSRYQQTGRLGNEVNGVEFGLQQTFVTEEAVWDAVIFIDDGYQGTGSDTLKFAQVYAGGRNIFPSQPDAYIWAGRRFNGRVYNGINDYYILVNDGTGGGVDNLNVGIGSLDMALVAGDSGNNDRYAFTSSLHDMKVTENSDLRLNFNYGFYVGDEDDQNDNVALAATFTTNWSKGQNQLLVRYSENTRRNSIDWGDPSSIEDLDNYGIYDFGSMTFTDTIALEYSLSYEFSDYEDQGEETWSQVVIKPVYTWNNYMSTTLELAYDQVEFDKYDATNSSWKATISQNFQMGKFLYSRPQIRLYTTIGGLDTEVNTEVGSTSKLGTEDAVSFGIMFDAYW